MKTISSEYLVYVSGGGDSTGGSGGGSTGGSGTGGSGGTGSTGAGNTGTGSSGTNSTTTHPPCDEVGGSLGSAGTMIGGALGGYIGAVSSSAADACNRGVKSIKDYHDRLKDV